MFSRFRLKIAITSASAPGLMRDFEHQRRLVVAGARPVSLPMTANRVMLSGWSSMFSASTGSP